MNIDNSNCFCKEEHFLQILIESKNEKLKEWYIEQKLEK